jgi:hypothetical protein
MVRGSCLCGDVAWEADGPFELMAHCHCTRCRKAHGTAFSTAFSAPASRFRLTRGAERVATSPSPLGFTRPFCRRCGSGVPGEPTEERVFLNAGSLGDDPVVRPLAHIFVASQAPWYELFDTLPRFDTWPPGFDLPVLADPPRTPPPPDTVRGSCLCGGVAFVVEGPPTTARYCHCSRCRKARAAAHAANLIAPIASVHFVRGSERLREFKLPEARWFAQAFCADCGGKLPRLDPERGIGIVPMGALDDDPPIRAACQIFTASKAPWIDLDPRIPTHPEAAPP